MKYRNCSETGNSQFLCHICDTWVSFDDTDLKGPPSRGLFSWRPACPVCVKDKYRWPSGPKVPGLLDVGDFVDEMNWRAGPYRVLEMRKHTKRTTAGPLQHYTLILRRAVAEDLSGRPTISDIIGVDSRLVSYWRASETEVRKLNKRPPQADPYQVPIFRQRLEAR